MTEKEKLAKQFIEAVKLIASKPENLDNLEHYLTHHFSIWLEKYASTPEDMVCEMKMFAEMKI